MQEHTAVNLTVMTIPDHAVLIYKVYNIIMLNGFGKSGLIVVFNFPTWEEFGVWLANKVKIFLLYDGKNFPQNFGAVA